MSDASNKIKLQDNSNHLEHSANMSEPQNRSGQDDKENVQPNQSTKQSEPWMSKPESYGNAAGDKIEGFLSPVGNVTGKAFETGAAPVGSLVDGTVGSVMRMGKGFGDQFGVGFGNEEGGPAKQKEAEEKKLKEDLGGQEQTADNPLGLNPKAG